jgi:hypothetical protein
MARVAVFPVPEKERRRGEALRSRDRRSKKRAKRIGQVSQRVCSSKISFIVVIPFSFLEEGEWRGGEGRGRPD